MLPELDGRAVIRAVRRDDEAAATPILMLSARGSTVDRIAGLEDGADDYLPKPFSPAELVLRVKSILRRSAAGEAGRQAPGDAAGPHRRRPPLRRADLVVDPDRHEVDARRPDRPADPGRVPAAAGDPRGRRPGPQPRPAARRGLRPRRRRRPRPDGRRPRRPAARQARRRRRRAALRGHGARRRLSGGPRPRRDAGGEPRPTTPPADRA